MSRARNGACSTVPCPCRGGGAAGVQRLAGAEHGRGAAAQHHQQRGAVITLSTADGLTKEESYVIAGKAVAEAAMNVENVEEVGITTDTSMAGHGYQPAGPAHRHYRYPELRQPTADTRSTL